MEESLDWKQSANKKDYILTFSMDQIKSKLKNTFVLGLKSQYHLNKISYSATCLSIEESLYWK